MFDIDVSVTAQMPETWAHPVDTVERSLKCPKAKIQTEACSSRAALETLARCPYSFRATWAVFHVPASAGFALGLIVYENASGSRHWS